MFSLLFGFGLSPHFDTTAKMPVVVSVEPPDQAGASCKAPDVVEGVANIGSGGKRPILRRDVLARSVIMPRLDCGCGSLALEVFRLFVAHVVLRCDT